jgi:N-acetylmuramoyl-L-alanine amidase
MKTLLANPSNYEKGRTEPIEYIVVHYTGDDGASALAEAKYFNAHQVETSAGYLVDETDTILSVNDNDIAWACGDETSDIYPNTNPQFHGIATNRNSINIEMSCFVNSAGKWEFKKETILNTIILCAELINKYPTIKQVIRHYDVTGKNCPAPLVEDNQLWSDVLNKIVIQAHMKLAEPNRWFSKFDGDEYASAFYQKWAASYL